MNSTDDQHAEDVIFDALDATAYFLRTEARSMAAGILATLKEQGWRKVYDRAAVPAEGAGHEHRIAAYNGYCIVPGCDHDGLSPEDRRRNNASRAAVQRG